MNANRKCLESERPEPNKKQKVRNPQRREPDASAFRLMSGLQSPLVKYAALRGCDARRRIARKLADFVFGNLFFFANALNRDRMGGNSVLRGLSVPFRSFRNCDVPEFD